MILVGNTIKNVPFFKDANEGFIRSLLPLLRSRIYSPSDIILSENEVVNEMYFISKGQVEVLQHEVVVNQLYEGSFFGEISLVMNVKSPTQVRTSTYCELLVLTKKDLEKVMKLFPEQGTLITEMATRRMTLDSLKNLCQKAPLFKDTSPEFQKEILSKFDHKIVGTNEFIYQFGSMADSMFFVGSGSLQFSTKNRKEIQTITFSSAVDEGSFFGYIDMLQSGMRTHSVRTMAKCFLFILKRKDLKEAYKIYPDDRKKVEHNVKILQREDEGISIHKTEKGPAPNKKPIRTVSFRDLSQFLKFNVSKWTKNLQDLLDDPSFEQLTKEDLSQASRRILDIQHSMVTHISHR